MIVTHAHKIKINIDIDRIIESWLLSSPKS